MKSDDDNLDDTEVTVRGTQVKGLTGQVLQALADQSRQLANMESRLENIEERTTVVAEWVNRKIAKREKKRQAKLARQKKAVGADTRGTQRKKTTRK